ncbi:MAG: amylo-alpha-1,6-glucosidase, partial [Methanomicrobiales archaeon]|nr:amylo-alpha-1,6-glucosidase [Methanomicrobiales archaeon]
MIAFGSELQDYQFAKRKEFLLTGGGGYCSQSLAGNTRKYHGLLVDRGRMLLSTCEEFFRGKRISVASYGGAVQDGGLQYLYGFCVDPVRFLYEVEGSFLQKTIEFDGSVCVSYDVSGEGDLRVVPLLNDRGIHETGNITPMNVHVQKNGIEIGDHLIVRGTGSMFVERADLYRNVWYEEDYARGYAHAENLFSPGYFEAGGVDYHVSLHASLPSAVAGNLRSGASANSLDYLSRAADDFLKEDTILAGYHWFPESWGRDALVSLPGLLLDRGKIREAEDVF